MVTDNQTNKVYFSKRLTWYKCWKELSRILVEADIDFDLLENTNDKWARDYMPIQVEKDKFALHTESEQRPAGSHDQNDHGYSRFYGAAGSCGRR